MSIRQILERAADGVDWGHPVLQMQADEVNVEALVKALDEAATIMLVTAHAAECMRDGTHRHPMQAFLHAVRCDTVLEAFDGAPLSDEMFVKAFQAWTKVVGAYITDPTKSFAEAFMRQGK